MASQWVGQWQGQWDGRLIGPIDPNFLTGTSTLYLSAQGSVYGAGLLAGDALFSLSALGNIENGVSVVDAYGTSGIQLGASATLFGTIQATGTAGVQFGASATLIGVLLATGAAQIVISSTGEAYLATNAAGSATLSLSSTGMTTALGALLGTGQVSIDGTAVLRGIGSLSGASAVSILPNGSIFSPLWTSGSTDITLGVTGGISGALWTYGQADIDLSASAMLTGIGSIAGQAWFALNTRYFDLNKYQRAYARHVLETVYALDVVEQIVSVAEQHNLSAIDSVDVVRVQTGDQTLFILPRRTVTVETPQRQAKQATPKPIKETRVAYALTGNAPVYASAEQLRAFAIQSSEAIVSSYEQEMLFITKTPSRSAHTPP